ncbi:flagellar export chaperone FliS [Vampirovibrio sp.]|uniref:flagellar export chaperone FliS n=1 Tax=Vampirovibrio sp. TaxID=2717857 RepID=UPI0035931F41
MNAPNPYAKQAETYKKNQIETATPEEILIMLYEGAIRFLLVAKKGDAENDREKFSKNIIKSQHIIREFMESLDLEIGGEMALNLYRLYDYLHYRLVQANIKKDVAMLDEVLDHLRRLKKTWEEAILIAKREKETARDEPEASLHA